MAVMSWDYTQFKSAFYQKTGLNLDEYKDKQMERRIRQLMSREEKHDFKQFFDYLAEDRQALERFMNYLTINTSEFFRDEKVYNKLENEIFPEMARKFNGKLKIWSAGCSIGAEPYTIAIMADMLKLINRLDLVATDIDDKALKTAREGRFNHKQLGKTTPDVIERYFQAEESEHYRLKPAIKNAVQFKRHNLLTDSPVSDCHMILCRNVFIYFKQETQQFLLDRFSSSLQPGGYLVIGAAEYISNPEEYRLQKRHNTIYEKK